MSIARKIISVTGMPRQLLRECLHEGPVLLVCICLGLTTLFSRDFVKTQIGPLYILEWVALAVMGLLLPTLKAVRVPSLRHPVWLMIPFILWGFFRFGWDLISVLGLPEAVPLIRALQFSILFVYPLTWVTLGYLLSATNSRAKATVALVLLVSPIFHLVAGRLLNVSVGPLMAVLLIWCCARVIVGFRIFGNRSSGWLCVFALAILSFMPFWEMVFTRMQRTNLGMLIFILLVGPQLLRFPKYTWKTGVRTTFTLFLLAIMGGFFYFVITRVDLVPHWYGQPNLPSVIREALSKQVISGTFLPKSFQKGDDGPVDTLLDSGAPKKRRHLHFRSRVFMWNNAYELWKNKPWEGVGFFLEVPSMLRENFPNRDNAVNEGEKAVSGPHNSYLQILSRMGLIGAMTFLLFLISWVVRFTRFLTSQTETSIADLTLYFVAFNGLFYALFNVGFESPHAAYPVWLACGMLLYGLSSRERFASDQAP